MLDTDLYQVDPAVCGQVQAVLDETITSLEQARRGVLVRIYCQTGVYFNEDFDPINRLIKLLQDAHRTLSYEGLLTKDAYRLLGGIHQELDLFQRRRFYRYVVRPSELQHPLSATLERNVATLAQIRRSLAHPLALASTPVLDPQLLDVRSRAWTAVSGLTTAGNAHKVQIVVPVYRGKEETLACLHSVLLARNETRARLVVINDCSPDEQLTKDLEQLALSDRFELIRHSDNRGFVSTVNEGILASSDDVVLLNADTLVSDRWLDHLSAAAQSSRDLGSVSPLSNNATILSYPHINRANPLPRDCSLKELCRLLEARVDGNALIEIPTSVGFCMYMPRHVIEDVGIFDEGAFGLGYGEECDWAMRARQKGYRHYVTTRDFVYHTGEVSFSDRAVRQQADAGEILRRRHPNYWPLVERHIAADPLSDVRRFLDCRRLISASRNAPVVLHVLHSLGGGTETHVRHISGLLKQQGILSIFIQPDGIGRMRLSSNFVTDIPNLVFAGFWDDQRVDKTIQELQVKCVHLHHILGFAPEVVAFIKALKVPLVATLHDYTYVCPQVFLLNQRNSFCGAPTSTVCHQCISAKRPIADVENVARWRESMHGLLSKAERVLAPSKTAAELYKRVWPDLLISVVPHPESSLDPKPTLTAPSNPRIVTVVGAILQHKGSAIVEACVRDAEERNLPLKFVVIGDFKSRQSPYLDVIGRFSRTQLPNILSKLGAVIGFLPSIWPETYSYVLSEYYRFGLHPVVFNIGAQSERVKVAGYGTILPLNTGAPAINDALMAIKLDLTPRQPPAGLPETDYLAACYGQVLVSGATRNGYQGDLM
jgi:GT2 family glycosyltransferase